MLQPYCLEKLVKECLSCIAKEYDAVSLQKAGIGWLYVTGTNFQDLPKGNTLITSFLRVRAQPPCDPQVSVYATLSC